MLEQQILTFVTVVDEHEFHAHVGAVDSLQTVENLSEGQGGLGATYLSGLGEGEDFV